MNQNTEFLLGASCLLPTFYYLLCSKQFDEKYHFLFLIILTDVIIEVTVFVTTIFFNFDIPPYFFNIYLLINFFCFLYLACINNFLNKKVCYLLIFVAIIISIWNGFFIGFLNQHYFFSLCFTSMVMLFVSIKILSAQIFETNKKVYKNFWFLFSCGSILYHAFTLLIFGLYYFSLFETPNGRSVVYIHHYINVAYYLILTWAIYHIPKSKNKMAYKNV